MTIGKALQATSRKAPAPAKRAAEIRGRLAELIAAGLLVLKGYRIVERRHRGPFGEIDLIAVRGRRIAFIEVKQRSSIEAATVAVSASQASRMGDAAERFLWKHPRYREHRVGLDLVVMGRSLVPRHIEGALHAW